MWVLLHWLRAVMLSGELEGGYVGAPTHVILYYRSSIWMELEISLQGN